MAPRCSFRTVFVLPILTFLLLILFFDRQLSGTRCLVCGQSLDADVNQVSNDCFLNRKRSGSC